jgi:hypothetical protein
MGLKNHQQVNYLKIKDGKFYQSTDKEHTTPYDEFEGIITRMNFREDEYQGQKIEKLQITLTDGTDEFVLPVSFNSSYASSLISFLKNADLTQSLTLVPTMKVDQSGKEQRSILVKQGSQFVKSFYTKTSPNGLPAFNKVKVNGKEVWDKTDYLDFLRDVVTNEFVPQLGTGNTTPTNDSRGVPTTETVHADYVNTVETDETYDDGLPF